MVRVITKIEHEEAVEVYDLIEKKNALRNLEKLLGNKYKKEELHSRCKKDYEAVNQLYQKWWDKIIKKYRLDIYQGSSLSVDIIAEDIRLM